MSDVEMSVTCLMGPEVDFWLSNTLYIQSNAYGKNHTSIIQWSHNFGIRKAEPVTPHFLFLWLLQLLHIKWGGR